jgi:type I restriction enzyme S subunit
VTILPFDNCPPGWMRVRLGQVFEERREKVSDRDFSPLSVTMKGIVPQLEAVAKTDDGDNRKRVCAGDLVINSRSDRKGSSGLSPFDGSVSLINLVLKPRMGYPPYLHHLLRSPAFQEEFYRWGHGIVADLWTTRFSDMKGIWVALPPEGEQRTIAEFLVRETARIDTLVAKQEAFVGLLEEQRRAIISAAVTGGLGRREAHHANADAALATLPRGWTAKRLKYLAAEITVGVVVTPSKYYAEAGVPALRSLNIRPMEAVRHDLVFFDEASNRLLSKSMLRAGDLVAVRTGKPGTTAVVGPDLDGANCIDLILIRRSPRFDSRFMAYVMNSDLAHAQYAEGSEGALQQHFNIETAKNLVVPAPPLAAQKAIAADLDARLARHDALRDGAVEMIERLREHRAALITAAVTGGISAAVSLLPNRTCVSPRAA